MEGLPLLSGNWIDGGLRHRMVHDRTRASHGDHEEITSGETWSENGSILQRLAGNILTRGTHGTMPRAATS